MIITKHVEIKTMGISIGYYKKLGYPAEHKKTITINVKDLSLGSDIVIEVKCDYCHKNKYISYNKYNISLKNSNLYSCNECKGKKTKKSCLKKYGVENVSQIESVKKKKEATCLKNYSVTNPSYSPEILEKIGNSLEAKFGFRHALQNKNILHKAQKTTEEKYGVKNALKNKTLLEKSKETCFKNNGVEFSMQSPILKEKIKKTRIKRGNQIPDELLSEWEIYKKKVKNETNKFKKDLFIHWDGYDFYDGKYIKNNFELYKCRSSDYPTIDHKISTFYGFKNNISEKIIGNINNLCITKMKINSSKKDKNIYNQK